MKPKPIIEYLNAIPHPITLNNNIHRINLIFSLQNLKIHRPSEIWDAGSERVKQGPASATAISERVNQIKTDANKALAQRRSGYINRLAGKLDPQCHRELIPLVPRRDATPLPKGRNMNVRRADLSPRPMQR